MEKHNPLGYEQITTLSAAQGLSPPGGAKFALIHVETQAVRWRDDDTDPTATVGMPLPIDTYLEYTGNLGRIRFIQEAASAKLNVTYYGE